MSAARRAARLAAALTLGLPLSSASTGRAEGLSGADDSGLVVVAPGASAARAAGDGWRFDGELSVTWFGQRWGLGGVLGGNPDRAFFELQPVRIFDFSEPDVAKQLFLGLNPGLVIDHARATRAGFQVTLWLQTFYACCHGGLLMLPLVPFARADFFAREAIVSAGFMLKIPIPILGDRPGHR